ncbi:MAG: NAD-dependent epimerase/dehydratase family protein [Bacteriovoracia bacterium]
MNVLITGAAGFLGYNATEYFVKKGHLVAAVGLIESAFQKPFWWPELWAEKKVTTENIEPILEKFSPELVIHCAGGSSVAFSIENPQEDKKRTVDSTRDLCEVLLKLAPKATIVYPSSASVYGNCKTSPISESAPIQPASPYGEHKFQAEEILRSFSTKGLSSIVFRIFSLYGPGLKKQIFFDACQKLTNNNPKFSGTGNEKRDFVHIKDFLELVAIAVDKKKSSFEVFNVGSGTGTSVKELVTRIAHHLGSKLTPEFDSTVRKGDPISYVSENKAAFSLGWQPKIILEGGIQEYVEWYKKNT